MHTKAPNNPTNKPPRYAIEWYESQYLVIDTQDEDNTIAVTYERQHAELVTSALNSFTGQQPPLK